MACSRRHLLQGLAAAGVCAAYPVCTTAAPLELSGNLWPVHDPCIIKANSLYHVFSTSAQNDGPGLIHWRVSKDLVHWDLKGAVLPAMPNWVQTELSQARGIWAPAIVYCGSRYLLYYAVSAFGRNTSIIGLLTTPTLDTGDAAFGWKDEGVVVRSTAQDDFNAIDGQAFADDDGRLWLSWGSFWSGIKLAELDPATGKLLKPKAWPLSLLSRPSTDAAEAPVIFKRDGYYYLFASYDFCCRGVNSSYYTVVGRSRSVIGPYVDDKGVGMKKGGGRIVLHAGLDPSGRWKGPGHCDVMKDGDRDLIAYHAYDAANSGRPTLRIATLTWTSDGWPVAT